MRVLSTKLCLFVFMLTVAWSMPVLAQESTKKPVGEVVYSTYKEKGIDKALEMYQTLKQKQASDYVFDEFQLNAIGYKMMNEDNDPAAAKKVLWLNLQEYPEALNPNDSYGDVLVRLGEKEEAKKYYQAAVEKYNKQGIWERNISRMSKAKIATLDNKHQVLNFLVGDWTNDHTHWNAKNEEQKEKGTISFKTLNDMVLVAEVQEGTRVNDAIPGPVWIISYNAQNDTYESAWMDPSMTGLQDSELKLKSKDKSKIVLEESYEEDGAEHLVRHEIMPKGNTIQWVMYSSKNGEEFRKTDQFEMSRMNITQK